MNPAQQLNFPAVLALLLAILREALSLSLMLWLLLLAGEP